MKFTEEKQWLFASGVWFGSGLAIMSFGISSYMFPEEQYPILYSIFIGILFFIVAKISYNRFFNYEEK